MRGAGTPPPTSSRRRRPPRRSRTRPPTRSGRGAPEDWTASASTRGWPVGAVELGPSFRGVSAALAARRRGARRDRAARRPPAMAAYGVHPALLDAALQTVGAAWPEGREGSYVLTGLRRLDCGRPMALPALAHAVLHPAEWAAPEVATGDVTIFDGTGRVLACARGLELRRLLRDGLAAADQRPALTGATRSRGSRRRSAARFRPPPPGEPGRHRRPPRARGGRARGGARARRPRRAARGARRRGHRARRARAARAGLGPAPRRRVVTGRWPPSSASSPPTAGCSAACSRCSPRTACWSPRTAGG